MSDGRPQPGLEKEFGEVFSTYFQRMYLYARKLLKSDHLAEDVVEEVFYNLWKTNSDLSGIKEIETYLFVSVKNQVVRMLSKDPQAFVSLDLKNELKEVELSNPEDILLEKELVSLIDEEISKLPEQCQVIFKLSRNEHMDHQAIAVEMGISIDSVKSQIYKATSKIRECISRWKSSDTKSSALLKRFGSISLLLIYLMF